MSEDPKLLNFPVPLANESVLSHSVGTAHRWLWMSTVISRFAKPNALTINILCEEG